MQADERTCPECAETIKKAAAVCRYCGHRFRSADPSTGPRNEKEEQVARKSKIGCAVVLVALVLLVAFCTPETSDTPDDKLSSIVDTQPDADPFEDVSAQRLWITKSQDAIRGRLRDPDSAEFRETRFYSGGSVPVVCGEVNSRNGFGGYTGYQRFIASGDNQSIAFVASDVATGDSIDVAWDELCISADTDDAYVP